MTGPGNNLFEVINSNMLLLKLGCQVNDENISKDQRRHSSGLATTRISLERVGSFGVLSRFAWYNLYMYCTARYSWFIDVGLVLEISCFVGHGTRARLSRTFLCKPVL